MNRFLLSYDVKSATELNSEEFRRILVLGLLRAGYSSLNSYSDSTILFNSFSQFDEIKSMVDDTFSQYISYVLVEVAKNEKDKFNSVEDKHESLSKNFDNLVVKIQGEINKNNN